MIPADKKREGDGASPIGVWPIKQVIYRPDRIVALTTSLPTISMRPSDGWCDDPAHPDYNRPVILPFEASHEVMWKDESVYDIVVVLGHNDDPPVAGAGSAIFMHVAREGYQATEGCVALSESDLREVLAEAKPGDSIAFCQD